MIHYKKPKKHQYRVEEVKGELAEMVKTLIQEKKGEKQILQEILDQIALNQIKSEKQLLSYCINNNCVEVLRRYNYILLKCL